MNLKSKIIIMANSKTLCIFSWASPGGSTGKNPPANAGDVGSVPQVGRHPEEGSGNPLWYSCLRNPMDRGARQAPVHGITKSQT